MLTYTNSLVLGEYYLFGGGGVWATPGDAQWLLLALHSGVIPGSA